LTPLFSPILEKAKVALKKILPEIKKLNVLEEAEFEDESIANDTTFAKQKTISGTQTERIRLDLTDDIAEFESSRIYKPRLLLLGASGMGQSTLASRPGCTCQRFYALARSCSGSTIH